MRAYLRVLTNHLSASLAYRWNILSGLALQLIQLLASLFVWKSIFADQTSVQGYSLQDMTTYLVITALLGVTFSSVHIFRLSTLVRKGTLSTYLIRPYSFLGDSLAVFIGGKVLEAAIATVVAVLLGGAGLIRIGPLSLSSVLLVVTNLMLLFVFGSLLGTLSFWMIEMWPLKPLYNSFMALLGGALFPLDLLPGIWRTLVQYTPFSLFGFVNTRAIQGALSQQEIWTYLRVSVGWTVLCLGMYAFLWRQGLKRYEGVNA